MLDWLWIIVCLIAILVEVITRGNLVSIWFAVGAAGAMLIQLLGGDIVRQTVFFIGLSVLAMLAIRPLAAKHVARNSVSILAKLMIGKQGVMERGSDARVAGELNLNGVSYSAIGKDKQPIPSGAKVEVVAYENYTFIVRKVE
jgi:membrane protein implicated in regulation of membrane protease activity